MLCYAPGMHSGFAYNCTVTCCEVHGAAALPSPHQPHLHAGPAQQRLCRMLDAFVLHECCARVGDTKHVAVVTPSLLTCHLMQIPAHLPLPDGQALTLHADSAQTWSGTVTNGYPASHVIDTN
jgi:hypothetical protein